MAADAGLSALAHFDFDGSAGFQIILIHAETAGSYLYNGVGAIDIKVFVKAAFTGIIIGTQRSSSPCQAFVCIIADGAVAHSREHYGHRQLQLRSKIANQIPVFVPLYLFGLLSQEHPGFHRLTQRVNRRVGHLRSVNQNLVPVNRQWTGVTHGRKQYAAALSLLINFADGVVLPVGVFPQHTVAFDDFQGTGGAQGHTPLAIDTFTFIAEHHIAVRVIAVYFIGALPLTNTALDAAVFVSNHFKFGIKQFHQKHPSFTLTMTGSPPAGA